MIISLSDWLVTLPDGYIDDYYAYTLVAPTATYTMKVRKVTSYKDPNTRTVVVIWRPVTNCGFDSGNSYISEMLRFEISIPAVLFSGLQIYGMTGVTWCNLLIVDNINLGEVF